MDNFYILLVVGSLASVIGLILVFARRPSQSSDNTIEVSSSPSEETQASFRRAGENPSRRPNDAGADDDLLEPPQPGDDFGHNPLRGDAPGADSVTDRIVSCTAFSPASVAPEATFIASIIVHLPEQANAAAELAQTGAPGAEKQAPGALFAPIRRGERITVHLDVTGAETVAPPFPIQLIWTGEPVMARFTVRALASGTLFAQAVLSVDGTPVGHAAWQIEISAATAYAFRDELKQTDSERFERVFISYNRRDMDIVRHIAATLTAAGIGRFLDIDSVPKGEHVSETVQKAIADCDLFILLWSENARNSAWVRKEMEMAYARWSTSTPRVPVLHVQARSLPIEGLPEEWREINYSDYLDYAAVAMAPAPDSTR